MQPGACPPPPGGPAHTHSVPNTAPNTARAPLPAVTGLVAHNVTPDTRIGAEVVRDLAKGTTTFAAGAPPPLLPLLPWLLLLWGC